MSQQTKRSLSLVSAALVLVLSALFLSTTWASGDEDGPLVTVTMPTTVEVALLRAGLNAEAFAAAGVLLLDALGTVRRGKKDLTPLPASLASADTAYADARRDRDRLRRLVRSGQGTTEDVAALAQAKDDLAAAEAQRASVLDSVFAAATSELSQDQVAVLTQVRANARWKLPTKYKVGDRTEAEWFAIRDALAHVRTHEDFGLEPDSSIEAGLAAFDDEQAVSDAAASCGTHQTGCEAVWEATFVD